MATTTNYGFEIPDNTDLVKDGAAAMRELGQDVDTQLFTALGGNYPGLRLVKKQTIGTAVASVAVTDAFSATYENYQIVVSGGASSAQNLMFFTLTGGTSAYDYTLLDILYNNVAFRGDRAQNASSFPYAGSGNSTNGLNMVLDIQQPFLTKFTYMGSTINTDSAAGRAQARHKAATSYTGFTLTANTGTFTGGTIYVYGYGIS
jgi:hypothetical protein